MQTFREKVRARWPHYDDRRNVFLPGATQDEMRRVALETQLDCKLQSRAHLGAFAEYLPKLYFEGNVEDCDFAALPKRYVIKPRCQTGVLMLMDDGVDLKSGRRVGHDEIRAFFARQWCYRGLNNDVLVEEMVENRDGSPCVSQFKCLTFHGRVEYIHYVTVGYDLGCVAYDYDRDWKRVALYHSAQPIEREIPRPGHFPFVIALAEQLADYYRSWTGIEHVRVDLFDSDKGPVFGEYAGGTNGGEGFTEDAQRLLGSLW
ncbi:ATP-grasp fold amidoligase family protein [Burkholderia ubonensis]|uniref:ATP Grasp n=1 Tax=Burkholderia ubonensis subsp. mesacidophila TaxID=265293 RepID=A0A2A4FM58_9BURK|nr:ATP-grasp fold amidoligase family protein [Burkholderia ubonensis]PCE33714.1 ATP Grasp [Burkholderia ubonensis subsp. mesacidophila]